LDSFGNQIDGSFLSSTAILYRVKTQGSSIVLSSRNLSKVSRGFEYVATVTGWYRVSVALQGIPVRGSPYSFQLIAGAASPATSYVFAAPTNTTVLYAGEDVVFFIQSRDQYSNDIVTGGDAFRVITVPVSVLSLEATVTDLFSGKYRVVASPPQQGVYTFGIQLLNQPVGSPVAVMLRFGRTNVTLSAIVGSGVCEVQAGTTATFVIVSRDRTGLNKPNGGDFYQVLLHPIVAGSRTNRTAAVIDLNDGKYRVEYSMTWSARYFVQVKMADMHVAASPYEVYVSPSVINTTLSRLQALNAKQNGTSGSIFGAELIAVDMFGNVIGPDDIGASLPSNFQSSVTFGVTKAAKVDHSINLESSGYLTYSFFGTLSGTYTVALFLNMSYGLEHVANAPMAFIVSPSTVSRIKSLLTSAFLTVSTAGFVSQFQVFTKDEYSNFAINVVPELLTAQIFQLPRMGSMALVSANVSADVVAPGLLNVVYMCTLAGKFLLEIRYNSTHFESSPFVLTVHPDIVHPESSYISLGTLNGGIAPTVTTFNVDYLDRFGNVASEIGIVDPSIKLPSGFEVSVARFNRTKYSVRFSVPRAISLSVQVLVNNRHIKGSPFKANYVSNNTIPVLSNSASGFLLPLPRVIVAGSTTMLCAQARSHQGFDMSIDYAANRLLAQLSFEVGSGSIKFTSYVDLKASPGTICTWNINMIITRSASYVLSASIAGINLGFNLPHAVSVFSGPINSSTTIVFGSGLASVIAGSVASVSILGRDSYGNPVDYGTHDTILFESPIKLSVPLKYEDGQYFLSFTTSIAGMYPAALFIRSSASHLQNSPWNIRIVPASFCASTSTLDGALAPVTAGIPSRFIVQARDAFSNSMSAGSSAFQISAWIGAGDVVSAIQDRRDGTYVVNSLATKSGLYSFSIFAINPVTGVQNQISGSPFAVKVLANDAGRIVWRVADDLAATAGLVKNFAIVAMDKFRNALDPPGASFSILIVTGAFSKPGFVYLNDGGYFGQFVTTVAGLYTISVFAQGSHIEGSPFSNVRVHPAFASGITSVVERYDSIGTAGATMSAIVRIKDVFGNQREDISDAPFVNMNGTGTSSFAFQSTYALTFVSRISFVGVLSINAAGSVVFETKLIVTVHPGDALPANTIISGFEAVDAGSTMYASIVVRDQFNNSRYLGTDNVSVVLLLGNSTYQLNIKQSSTVIRYETQFIPTASGRYHPQVQVNGRNVDIPVAIQSIEVSVGPFDISGCSVFSYSSLIAGDNQIFTVAYADAFGNPQIKSSSIILSIELRKLLEIGEIASDTVLASPSDVLANVAEHENFMSSITASGYYIIEVNRRDLAIAQPRGVTIGSITIAPGAPSFRSSTALGTGLIAVKFGTAADFVVMFRDVFGNSAIVSSVASSPLTVGFESSSPNSANVTIRYFGKIAAVSYLLIGPAQSFDSMTAVNVKISNLHIEGSPFKVKIVLQDDDASPINTTIFYDQGLPLTAPFTIVGAVGKPVELSLKGRSWNGADAPLFKNLVSISPSPVNLVSVTASPETSAITLRYSFTITQSGSYVVNILYDSVALVASPVTFKMVPSAISAPLGIVEGVSTSRSPVIPVLTAGAISTLSIFARDAFGNSRARDGRSGFGSDLSFVKAYLKSLTVTDPILIDLEPAVLDDRIIGSYIPTVAAAYSLHVLLKDLPYGPGFSEPGVYKVFVRPGSILFSACSLSGSGLSLATVGSYNSFYVITRDRFFNEIVDASDETSSTFAAVVEHKLGTVPRLSFSSGFDIGLRLQRFAMLVTVAGIYSNQVSLGGAASMTVPNQESLTAFASTPSHLRSVVNIGNCVAEASTSICVTLYDTFMNVLDPFEFRGTLLTLSDSATARYSDFRPSNQPRCRGMLGSFIALESRIVRVNITMDNMLIDGSPFSVFVQKSLPPKVVEFAFGVGGSHIVCRFASDTNMANQGNNVSVPCSRIFDDPSMILLTHQSICSFTSGSSMTILLPAYNQASNSPPVKIGDKLFFNDNVIYNSAYTSFAVQGAVIVAPPIEGGFPRIVLSVPSSVGVCADIPVDASQSTGGSSRPLSFSWKVQAAPGSKPISLELGAFVSRQKGADFIVPNSLLPLDSAIILFLSISNMFERSAFTNVTIYVSALAQPSVTIEGPVLREFTLQEWVEITARANSTCSGFKPVAFTWNVVKQSLQGALPSLTSEMRSVRFIPGVVGMLIGVSYTLEVEATVAVGNTNLSSSAVVVVRIVPADIVLKANLGTRVISSTQHVDLDLSQSYDPDLPKGSISGISFGWSCNPVVYDPRSASGFATVDQLCFDNQISILGSTLDKLTVYGEDSPLFPTSRASLRPGIFQFSISGVKSGLDASRPRNGAVIIVIHVVKQDLKLGPPFDVSIRIVSDLLTPNAPLAFRYNGPQLTEMYTPKWEFRGFGSEINLESSNFTSSTPGTLFLVIKQNILAYGQTYTLRLSVNAPGRATGWAEIVFTTPYTPSGGTCNILPRAGFAFNTTFTLSCQGWSTDSSLTPLKYQWMYFDETVSSSHGFPLVSIVALTTSPSNKIQLPVSRRINTAGFKVVARIVDKSGALTEIVLPYRILVQSLPIAVTTSSAFLGSSLASISNIAANGDANVVFGALNALLSMDVPGKPSLFDLKWNSLSPQLDTVKGTWSVWQQQEQSGSRSVISAPSAAAATQKALTAIVFELSTKNIASADLAVKLADSVANLVNFNPDIIDDEVVVQLHGILRQSKSMADATQSISDDFVAAIARAISFFKVSLRPVVSEFRTVTDEAVSDCTAILEQSIRYLVANKLPGQTPFNINIAGFSAFGARLRPYEIDSKNVALSSASVSLSSDTLNASLQSHSESLQLVVNEYSQDTTPFRLISSSSLVRLTSPTLSIQILDDTGVPISLQTRHPFIFVIKRPLNLIETAVSDAKVEECRFWDVSKEIWSKQGCIVSSPPAFSELHCTCYHLTSFSGVNVKNPSTQISEPADLQSMLRFDINMDVTLVPTTTIILLATLYLLSVVWGHLLDVNQANKYRQDPKNFLKLDRLRFGLTDGNTLTYWKVAKIEFLRKHDLLTLCYLRPYDRSSRPRILAGFFVMIAAGSSATAVSQAFLVSNYVALGELGVMTVGRIFIPGLVGSGVGYFILLITKFLFSFVRRFTATAPSLNPSGESRKSVDHGPLQRPALATLPPLQSVSARPAVSSSVPQLNLAGTKSLPLRPRVATETRESRRQQYYHALRTMFSASGGTEIIAPQGTPADSASFSSRVRSNLSPIEEAPEPQRGVPRPRIAHVVPPSSEAPGKRRVRMTGVSPPGTARLSSSRGKQEELARNIDTLLPAQVAYIIYTMLAFFVALCIYVTMAYTFRMDSPTAYIWLLSLGVIVMMHAFVWEPIRVLGIIASKFAVLHATRLAQAKVLEAQRMAISDSHETGEVPADDIVATS